MSDHRTLVVWQMADAIARSVMELAEQPPLRQRYALRDQLTRACLSVPCNIVEGYARSSPGQLKYHLDVAIGSLAEAQYLLSLAADLQLTSRDAVDPLLEAARSLHPRLAAFARSVQQGRARHSRFQQKPPALPAGRGAPALAVPISRGGEAAEGARPVVEVPISRGGAAADGA